VFVLRFHHSLSFPCTAALQRAFEVTACVCACVLVRSCADLGQLCPDNTYDCIVSPFAAISAANTGGVTKTAPGCTITGNITNGWVASSHVACHCAMSCDMPQHTLVTHLSPSFAPPVRSFPTLFSGPLVPVLDCLHMCLLPLQLRGRSGLGPSRGRNRTDAGY
jgi:hypothetical protein